MAAGRALNDPKTAKDRNLHKIQDDGEDSRRGKRAGHHPRRYLGNVDIYEQVLKSLQRTKPAELERQLSLFNDWDEDEWAVRIA